MASRDGKVYSSLSIGSSPYADVKATTNIPVVIVPLVVTVNGVTLDPTAAVTNSCVRPDWNGKTPVQVLLESPIFTATDWTMNGQQVGKGQYLDAFQRAQYWSLVQGSNYHTVLHPTVAAAQTVPVSALDPSAATATSACVAQSGGAPDQITLGASDTGLLTPWLEGTLIPQLKAQGVINSGQLAYFLFYNTTFSDASGFHSYVGTQTYAVSLINGSDCCSPDVKTISSVAAEWMNDPFPAQTQNRTPGWTAQADSAGNALVCQSNSSVGDPTAGSLFPDVAMPNGVTYHPQELTFYSWFHGAPSIGAGSLYSNNSSLAIDAGAVCQADTTPALSITTPAIPNGVLNTPFSFTLTASGGTGPYAWSVAGGRLPPGLTLSPTGLISGTPSYVTLGSLVTFQVTDASNPPQMASAYYIMTVSAIPVLQITTFSLNDGVVGAPYSQTLAAPGGTLPYTWQLTAGTLPAGLTLNPATGVISGTPAVAAAATPLTFKVTDSSTPPQSVSAAFTLTIAKPQLTITTTALNDGILGVPYSQTLTATGGTGAYTWQLTAGTLPAGLTLNPSTGAISGTPTAPVTATPLTFKVTDSGTLAQSTAFFTLTITTPLRIEPPLCLQVLGQICPIAGATGGTPPYTWAATGLPPGLTLNPSTGLISGTPVAYGIFPLFVTVTDSGKPPQSVSAAFTLTIPPPLTITTTALLNGTPGVPYSQMLAATGGTPPFAWTATGLPPGLALNPATGLISGTPMAIGAFTLSVTVTDSGTPPLSATKQLSLIIPGPPLTITTAPPNGMLGVPYSFAMAEIGGTPPFNWGVSGLPPGLTLNPSTGVISGTPVASGTFTPTFKLTDSGTPPQSATAAFPLVITPPSPTTTITTPALPNGAAGTPYTFTLTATGGTAPYTWSLIAGRLPAGMTFNPFTGVISGIPDLGNTGGGTPTFQLDFLLTFQVTDSGNLQQTSAPKVLDLTITDTTSTQ